MTQTAPIVLNHHDDRPVVGGPAALINASLGGAAPLTITGKKATGDIVWLAPVTERVWRDDAITVEDHAIAWTISHPVHGEIAYAYIDMSRLDRAPQVSELTRALRAADAAAYNATMAQAAKAAPSCDNCGDCPQCC
jgi:hypothetical protein